MRQLLRSSVLVLGLLVFLPVPAVGGEETVLKALEDLKAGVEAGIPYTRLVEVMETARGEVNRVDKGAGNACFRAAVRRSYDWYALGVRSWASLMENEKERDKYARQAEYGEHDLKEISLKMAENYDKLVKHAQDALPSKWARGGIELEKARMCLEPRTPRRR